MLTLNDQLNTRLNQKQAAQTQYQQVQQKQREADRAELAGANAHKALQLAQEQRELVQPGSELEGQGVAMRRLSPYKYHNYDTSVAALELERGVKALWQKTGTPKSLNNYPAISTSMELRVAENSVVQVAQFQGYFPSFSPNGQQVLFWDGNTSRLYDLRGQQLAQFQGYSPRFSPNGQQVLTWDVGTTSRLYDLKGQQLAQFQGHFPSFSPNGQQVLFWDDSTSRLYDLQGQQLAQFQDGFTSFSPDGKQVLTQDSRTTIRLYDLQEPATGTIPGHQSQFQP